MRTHADQVHLHVEGDVECLVHPVVLFSIVDHYTRREEGQGRVIGTLLGTCQDGQIEAHSCFPVPHTETEEQVAVNTDFHRTMLNLHQRTNPKLKVIGWYSTGEDVNDSSLLLHEFYGQDVEQPVHLLLDLGLGERRMSSKAYVLRRLGLGGRQLGVMFEDIKLRVHSSEADRIGLDTLAKTMGDGIGGTVAISEADSIEVTTTKLLSTLDALAKYVAGVKAGSATPDAEVVQLLQDAMTAAPRLPAQTFDKIFNSRVQDMLVVVYLANLTRAQLTLAEKLQGISNAA